MTAAPGNVYLFARAPALGAVKRRLAADIGDMAARAFYRETTRAVLRRIAGDVRWRTWLAVTPDSVAARGRFWPGHTPRIPQGGGDLGVRMARALGRFPDRPAVVVGSDIPDLGARHIAAAFAALADHDVVVGPAEDGGYWLIGVRPGLSVTALFTGVRWSSPHALGDTLANLDGRHRVARLETLQDIDDGVSFARRFPVRPRWSARDRPSLV